jgi:hypothetical protein
MQHYVLKLDSDYCIVLQRSELGLNPLSFEPKATTLTTDQKKGISTNREVFKQFIKLILL